MNEERKIAVIDSALFRTQAIVENTLKIQCEILSYLTKRPFEEIMQVALTEIDRDTKELITLYSNIGGDSNKN